MHPWPLTTCPKCQRKTDAAFIGKQIGDELHYWRCLECGTEFPAEPEPAQTQDDSLDELADV